MNRKLICIGLGVILAVSALGFAACSGDEKAELNKQLSAAQTKVEQQETTIAELQKQNEALNEHVEEFAEKIKNLEAAGMYGAFYHLGEAYDNGWLTKEDIMHIAYFSEGVVNGPDENGDKKPIEFTPSIPEPVLSNLSKIEEKAIVAAFYQIHPRLYQNKDKYEVKILQYLGNYHDNYICVMWTDFFQYGMAAGVDYRVADIWFTTMSPGAWVFHVSND